MLHNDKLRQALAERLRASRESAGLSQGQVAKCFGYQRPTISEIEAGRRKVSAEELSRFSELYDVSLAWLTSGDSEFSDPSVELAARELKKLSKGDLDRLMHLIKTLRRSEKK